MAKKIASRTRTTGTLPPRERKNEPAVVDVEVSAANERLDELLTSTDFAIICLDRELRIMGFTPAATRLLSLSTADVGRPFQGERHGLSSDDVQRDARHVLDDRATIDSEIVTVEGSVYLRRMTPYRTGDDRIEGVVLTLVDITEHKQMETSLREAKELSDKIVNTVREPMLVLDENLRVISANDSFYSSFAVPSQETEGRLVYELGNGQWDIPQLRELLENVLPQNKVFNDYVVEHDFPRIGRRTMLLNARRINALQRILLAIEDVTFRKKAEESLQALNQSLEDQVANRVHALAILHDVTLAANEAETVEEAVRAALKRICDYNDWLIGHAWRRDDKTGQMVSSKMWHVLPDADDSILRVDQLKQITDRASISPEQSLVGRVVASGQPQWIEDLRTWEHWDRGNAEEIGLHAAIAFPITADGEIVAVLEFFSDKPLQREDRFMEIMPNVGIQLGHLIERKRLERSVAEAASAKQRYFAQELHDSIAQELTGIQMMGEMLRNTLQQAAPEEAAKMDTLVGHVREAQQQVRRLSRGLMPVEVHPNGLARALEELAENCQAMQNIRCHFRSTGSVEVDHSETATQLYRIAQEAVQNALKHAAADEIVISLEENDGHLVLSVRDNGAGFSDTAGRSAGSGQRIMRHRANLIGGDLHVVSQPGDGVTVTCRLPRDA